MVFTARGRTVENPLDLSIIRDEMVGLRANEITDYDPLIGAIGDARFVLLGEASHGTHDFYRERALITRRLIEPDSEWDEYEEFESFPSGL